MFEREFYSHDTGAKEDIWNQGLMADYGSTVEHDHDPRLSDMMGGSLLFMCSNMDSALKHQIAVSADHKILVHEHCRFSNNQCIFSTVVFHLWVPRNENLLLRLLRLFVFIEVSAVT